MIRIYNKVDILFILFFVFTLLTPVLFFNKFIFLIIIGLLVINYKFVRLRTISPFFILFIFSYGFFLSFFNNVHAPTRNQFFFSIFVLFLIYPIIHFNVNLERIVKISGLIVVAYTAIFFLVIVLFKDLPFSGTFYDFFNNYSLGSFGMRDFSEEATLAFHIGCAPFLYLPLVIYVISFSESKKVSNLIAIILILIAIVISGSRGTVISSFGAILYITYFKSSSTRKTVILFLGSFLIIFFFNFVLQNSNIFDSSEEGNSVKIGHFKSFIDNIDFINFFLGEGLGSYYYTKGANGLKSITEITPLDILRFLGFVLTPILYIFILIPIKGLKSYLGSNSIYLILVLIYLLNSLTNPILFNSYGLLIILWYWYKIINSKFNSSSFN